VYSAEDAVINFGGNQTLLWSEIKDTVDFTKLIVDSSGNFPNLTTAQTNTAQTLQDVIDIKNSTTSSFITNRHPGDFLLESDAGNTTQSIINGGRFSLSGPDTQIILDGNKGGGSTKTTTITEEQVQIADTDDSTLLTFSSDSIQTQDGSGTITITPNSIQFEPVLQNQSTLTSVTIGTDICILGTIDLGASPTSHESGPEYKLTVRVNKQSSQSMSTDYMAFTMHINVGSWLNNINNPNSYTLLDDASFNEGSDRLLFSDNISSQTFYYKRDGRTISIAWLPVDIANVTPLQYKLTQVA
tara:strand:- start:6990 stop:7889 length:900 start_codon:yes stop_codon:yes gene_type:complete